MTNDLWDEVDTPSAIYPGGYIAVSGNTGAGKSTLVNLLSSRIRALGLQAVGVNERTFHHPLLRQMFANPQKYALPVQLNFLVQRSLFLIRSMENNHLVVLERSHYDDPIFIREHYDRGHISSAELDAYLTISERFGKIIPAPDVFVFLNVSPQTSFERITYAEKSGERPCEFPNDDVKLLYINSWHKRYQAFFAEIRSKALGGLFSNTMFFEFTESVQPQQAADRILDAWGKSREGNRNVD